MMADDERRDAIFRGNLLEVSSLLTKLQSHLVPEGLSRVVPFGDNGTGTPLVVTIQDMIDVFNYQSLLAEEEEIQNQIFTVEEFGRTKKYLRALGRVLSDHIKGYLKKNQANLQKCSTRTKHVHFLWTRLVVWWTKVVAQQLLVVEAEEFVEESNRSASVDCCASPLMNLPGSAHFQAVIPGIVEEDTTSINEAASAFFQNKLSCCSLPLPPNKHTWKEYARISRMVLLLENQPGEGRRRKDRSPREQALKSPCCVHGALVNRTKHVHQAQSKDFDFAPPHLIALWVRAQRNTQAMRHLWMIFELYPKSDSSSRTFVQVRGGSTPGSGKHLVVGEQPIDKDSRGNGKKKSRSFTAVLRGNPTYAKSRIADMSHRTDQLVEWAVTNQVLFTHKHILKYLMITPMFQKKRKINFTQPKEQLQRKRIRRDLSQESNLLSLKMACLSFLVRWFARRNRFVASFLYSLSIEHHHLDPASTQSDQAAIAAIFNNVVKNVHVLLKEAETKENSSVCAKDRYFARLDERLFLKGVYDIDDDAGRDQVMAMLEALQRSATWNASQHAQIERAKQDFDVMYDHFFGDKNRDVYNIALDLVNKEAQTEEEIIELLKSIPSPWPRGCSTCESNKGTLVACANCEKIYHPDTCSPRHLTLTLPEVISSHKSLQRLCVLKHPNDKIHVPDYTNDHTLTWTEVEINIEREIRNDGSVTPLGLGLRTVEDCQSVFDKLYSAGATVIDLIDILNMGRKAPYPMKGIKGGFVVVETKDGDTCGKPAGIQPGDVIVAVEHLKFASMEEAAQFGQLGTINMVKLPSVERLEVLKVASTKLRIRVLRPNRKIVQESRAWYSRVKGLNRTFATFLRDDPIDFWFCGDCLTADLPSYDIDSPGRRIVEEARRCLAVIHRVGLESFALPFVDEDIHSIQKIIYGCQERDALFISLRRLDAMMTAIIQMYSSEVKDMSVFSTAFMLPPWAVSDHSTRRLEWAPEVLECRPTDLICSALAALQDVDEKDEKRNSSKRKMIRYFLILLSSWCALPSALSENSWRTKGPPECFLHMREPWLLQTCVVCCGRPRDGAFTCRNSLCSKMANRNSMNVEDIKCEKAPNVVRDIMDYNKCSSLVGQTLLLLPDDPLVTALKTYVQVEHCGRPVEFLIASYLPAPFDSEVTKAKSKDALFDKFSENEGIFHLLPMVSSNQLFYLLERSKSRRKATEGSDIWDVSWTSLDLLDIPGVARYSFQHVEKMLMESDAMRHSIDDFIAQVNSTDDGDERIPLSRPMWSSIADRNGSDSRNQHEVAILGSLLDTTLWKELLPQSVKGAFSRIPAGDADEIVCENEFGDVALQKGLHITNTVPIVLDIVRPTEHFCVLVYSDLHYSSPMELPSLMQELVPQVLEPPKRACPSFKSSIKTLLLQRSNTSLSYKGVGFGYEVVRWAGETSPRIGRIHKNSPAFEAGLETGDILLSAGGEDITDLNRPTEVVHILLGSPMRVRLVHGSDDSLRLILSAVKQSRMTLDSVVLTICRTENEDSSSLLSSSRGISRVRDELVAMPCSNEARHKTKTTHFRSEDANGTRKDPIDLLDDEDQPMVSNENGKVLETKVVPAYPSIRQYASADDEMDDFEPIPIATSHKNHAINFDRSEGGLSSARLPIQPQVVEQDHGTVLQSQQTSADASQSQQRVNMKTLFDHVLTASARRVSASFGHLYRPAENGTILTLMECAVFLECLQSFMPKLGIRLLCPRYNFAVITDQICVMAGWSEQQVARIPRLSASIYGYILNIDYKRATNPLKPEGPVKFTEGPHRYCEPVDILPIDRQIEKALDAERRVQESQRLELQAHFQDATGPTVARRIQQPQPGHSHLDFLDQGGSFPFPPAEGYTSHHAYQYFAPPQHHGTGPSFATMPRGNTGPLNAGGGSADLTIRLDDGDSRRLGFGERIRGGGPLSPLEGLEHTFDITTTEMDQGVQCLGTSMMEELQNEKCLSEVPVQEWKNLPVYLFVDTDDERESDTMMVGWIKDFKMSATGNLPDTVDVEAHYLANMGYFVTPQIHSFYPEDIFVVDENTNTESSTVIKKLRAKGSAPAPVNTFESEFVATDDQVAAAYEKSIDGGMKILGRFPDTRLALWIPNDPQAIYITMRAQSDVLCMALRDYTSLIGQHAQALPSPCPKLSTTESEFCCPWGCSVQEDANMSARIALSFDSISDLQIHLDECHSYGSDDGTVELGLPEKLVRVHEGQGVLDLNYDISSTIVANLPLFWLDAVKHSSTAVLRSSGREFTKSPTGEKLSLRWSDSSLRSALSDQVRKVRSNILRSVVDLWTAMGHLFFIDGSGLFRLKHTQFESSMLQKAKVPNKDCRPVCNTCERITFSATDRPRRFFDCALCSLPWEKCIRKLVYADDSKVLNARDEDAVGGRGLGCMLRSDVSFVKTNEIVESTMRGTFGEAKTLLFRVADFVQGSFALQSRKAVDDKADPLHGFRLWDGTNFEVWKAFVSDCCNEGMFLQALIVLLGSVDRSKMPKWWRRKEGGWSTSQMIMAQRTMEVFFLHLYVFDTALSETIGTALGDELVESPKASAQHRSSSLMQQRMKRYLALAQEMNFRRFHGLHNTDCMTCDDGGRLLCCELCSNVQHAKCCEPPLDDEAIDEIDWVCDSCINDICHKKGIPRED